MLLRAYGSQISSKPSGIGYRTDILTFKPTDRSDKTRMLFSVYRDRVTSIIAGRLPEVEAPQGCL